MMNRSSEHQNRKIRVALLTGVSKLYVKCKDKTIRISSSGNKLQASAMGIASEEVALEFGNGGRDGLALSENSDFLDDARFLGNIQVRSVNNNLVAVNVLDVEDYLRGVVPCEIGPLGLSCLEALKAQAIAARTYAYAKLSSHAHRCFDVYADTQDQVYRGIKSTTPLCDMAIKETNGVVMTYGDQLISAYYHSTCGGHTETLATWGQITPPYLQVVDDRQADGCPWCKESKYIKWERHFFKEEIPRIFSKNLQRAKAVFLDGHGERFTDVKDIEIASCLPSGRIHTLHVETDAGAFEVLADRIRWLFQKNGVILPSSAFTIRQTDDEWVLTGTGFGHGIGMCQMGAISRARNGQTYCNILHHYYRGIKLERL